VFVSLGFIAIAILIRSAVVFLSIKISALTHDIMTMSLKHLDTLPGFVPVPQLNCHIITSGKNKALGWMDSYCAYIIWVGLKASNFLRSVVVQNPQLKVVRPSNNPILSRNKATCANRYIGELECFNSASCFVGPDVNVATVESSEDPWLLKPVRVDPGLKWAN